MEPATARPAPSRHAANECHMDLRRNMAKRPRDVEEEDLVSGIEDNDCSCDGDEVDAKEQLLKEGHAEEAWQLYLDEEQAKYWRAVCNEVSCRKLQNLTSLESACDYGALCATNES
jgi:hypothetical protein